jgi:N-acetylmuramic acid 6-phosphate (MurNAc-6-P) etherase
MKISIALVMLLAKIGKQDAIEKLARAKGSVRGAIDASS